MKRTKKVFTLLMLLALLASTMFLPITAYVANEATSIDSIEAIEVVPLSGGWFGTFTSPTRTSGAGALGSRISSRNNQWSRMLPLGAGNPQGRNTNVNVIETFALQSNFVSSSARRLTIELWEADGWFSADDHVRTLSFGFTGRTPNSTALSNRLVTSGSIEGEPTFELYTIWEISRISGDPTNANVASGLFNYNITYDWRLR